MGHRLHICILSDTHSNVGLPAREDPYHVTLVYGVWHMIHVKEVILWLCVVAYS